MAEPSDVDPKTIQRWEQGERLAQLAAYLSAIEAAGMEVLVRAKTPD